MKRLFYLICVAALLAGCTSLKTPEINGVVVDAETERPIEGAYVVASWGRIYGTVGGPVGKKDFKEIKVQTDANGHFIIPRYTAINWEPYPFGHGGSFFMAIYLHEYMLKKFLFYKEDEFVVSKYQEFIKKQSDGEIVFKMEIIKDSKSFEKNRSEVHGLEDNLNYQLKDYQLYIEKFPKGEEVPGYLLSIGSIYEKMKKPEKAIQVYRQIIDQFPDTTAAKDASKDILRLLNK